MLMSLAADLFNFPDRPSILDVLRSSTLLNSLHAEEFDDLARTSHLAFAERGDTIWIRGADTDFFGLVGSGFVKMVMSSATGQEMTAELMGPGQVFGLLGTVQGTGCPLSARAVTHVWYLKVPKREFLPIYQKADVLKDALMRRTTNRLQQAYVMMSRMSSGKVSERIAAVLFILADSYGRPGTGGLEVRVPLTRQDIADLAGTTVESTIRVMSRWQKAGLISTEHRMVTLTDEEGLARQMR